MLLKLYWDKKKNEAIIPTSMKTVAGFWFDVEPVLVVSRQDVESMMKAMVTILSTPAFVIPTPHRRAFPKPVVLAYSGVKSESEFERRYELATLSRNRDGSLRLTRYKKAPEGSGMIGDEERSKVFSAETPLEVALSEVAELVASS